MIINVALIILLILFDKPIGTIKLIFLFWYEHYGSVEIGMKIWFNWFYNSTYPALEESIFNKDGLVSTANLNYEFKHFFTDDSDMYINPDWFIIKSDSN